MEPVQKYVYQPRHQALIKSNLRYFLLSEPLEFSAGVTCSDFYASECFQNYWHIFFLGCVDRVWGVRSAYSHNFNFDRCLHKV